jgi:hypothetical protein
MTAAMQYFALVIGLLGLNYASLLSLQALGFPLLPAKLVTELLLFVVSWALQRRLVFAGRLVFARRQGRRVPPAPDRDGGTVGNLTGFSHSG